MGHTRLTQTKGVWLWGEPVPVQLPSGETTNVGVDAAACIKLCAKACMPKPVCPCLAIPMAVASLATPWQAAIAVLQMPHVPLSLPALPWHSLVPLPQLQLLFIDTEGFESTGKADVYDDRIFALSALMSQVRGGRARAWGRGAAGSGSERCSELLWAQRFLHDLLMGAHLMPAACFAACCSLPAGAHLQSARVNPGVRPGEAFFCGGTVKSLLFNNASRRRRPGRRRQRRHSPRQQHCWWR